MKKRGAAGTRRKKVAVRKRKRRPARRLKNSGRLVNFFVPMFFIICFLVVIGVIFLSGYRSVTASSFFDVRSVTVKGNDTVRDVDIRRIVSSHASETGVWNADLARIKSEVESLTLVRHASVSRVLPDGISVIVKERIPRAVVRIGRKELFVDEDAVVLGPSVSGGSLLPFVMFGWDTSGTARALEINRRRITLYRQMVSEWKQYDLVSRVKSVDISDLDDPQARVSDSGHVVTIFLGGGDFATALWKGLETIAGQGDKIKYVIHPNDENPVIGYRNS